MTDEHYDIRALEQEAQSVSREVRWALDMSAVAVAGRRIHRVITTLCIDCGEPIESAFGSRKRCFECKRVHKCLVMRRRSTRSQ